MIHTPRLRILPLSYEQLIKYMQCDHSLEAELHLNHSPRTISEELKEALELSILPNVADSAQNYLYSTLWTGILKADGLMVGDLCILGEPNEAGEIEIGYGTYEAFQGQGFMTEMVGGIIGWCKTQPQVKYIRATTDKINVASYKVLEKNSFVIIDETETQLHWRLLKPNHDPV